MGVIVDCLPDIGCVPVGTKVYGPNRNRIVTMRLPRCRTFEATSVTLPSAWNSDNAEQAEHVKAMCSVMFPGVKRVQSIGSYVSALLRRCVPEQHRAQLPPRYRFLPREYFVGPMVVMSGGGLPGTTHKHYDIRNAYHSAMSMPVPVVSTYKAQRNARAMSIINSGAYTHGFIKGTVWIPEGPQLGPLPMRIKVPYNFRGNTAYRVTCSWPTGYVTGTWPIPLVTNAIRNYGATVTEVEECITASQAVPVFTDFLRTIDDVYSKHIDLPNSRTVWKGLYTRAWTKFRPAEWVTGEVTLTKRGRRTVWTKKHLDWMFNRYPPSRIMRPDVTCYIAAWNILKVVNKVNSLPYGTVSSVHIDSIHTTETIRTSEHIGQWRLEKTGYARFYYPGEYTYGEKPATRTGAEEITQSHRVWHEGLPQNNPTTYSDPVHNTRPIGHTNTLRSCMVYNRPHNRYRSIWDTGTEGDTTFTSRGWTK